MLTNTRITNFIGLFLFSYLVPISDSSMAISLERRYISPLIIHWCPSQGICVQDMDRYWFPVFIFLGGAVSSKGINLFADAYRGVIYSHWTTLDMHRPSHVGKCLPTLVDVRKRRIALEPRWCRILL